MSLPELSRSQYNEVVEQYRSKTDEEPETYWLQALDPDQLFKDNWNEPDQRGIRIRFLCIKNVSMYVDEEGNRFIIWPDHDDVTYDDLFEIWPTETKPFGFIIRENRFDDLEDVDYYFRWGFNADDGNEALPEFKLANWRTH